MKFKLKYHYNIVSENAVHLKLYDHKGSKHRQNPASATQG